MLLLLFPLQMIFKQDGLYIGDRVATWMFYVSTYHQSPFKKSFYGLFLTAILAGGVLKTTFLDFSRVLDFSKV